MHTDVDVIELLERDHRRIDDLAGRLDTVTDTAEIRAIYEQLVDALHAHERIEHEILFPAYQAMVAGASDDAAIDHRVGEHEELNSLLAEMRDLECDDFAFIKRGSALLNEIEGHFAEEEASVFARMRAEMPADELLALAERAMSVG
jgi:hypothetical protein